MYMRFAQVRATKLSLLAGGLLILGVLAVVWPAIAQAGSLRPVSATQSSSPSPNTDPTCQLLPASSTPSPSPTPSPTPSRTSPPSPSPSSSPAPSPSPSAAGTP